MNLELLVSCRELWELLHTLWRSANCGNRSFRDDHQFEADH